MKKILLSFMALIGVLTAQAESYSYLTFETTDGAKVSVSYMCNHHLYSLEECMWYHQL